MTHLDPEATPPPVSRRQAVGLAGAAFAAAPALLTAAPAPVRRSRRIALPARPAPLEVDLARTAVLVVDMTNDFGSKGGMFQRAGIDIASIQGAVAPTARVLAAARSAGVPVIYLSMAYRPDLSDVGPPESPNWRGHIQRLHVGKSVSAPDGSPTRILIRDSWGTRVLDALKPQTGEAVIYKTRFSGFYKTNLEDVLRDMGVRYLVVTGCTTSICVESTIRDAMFRDYSPVLLVDCAAEPIGEKFSRSNHQASLLLVEALLGWVSSSEAFIKAVQEPTSS